MRAMILLPHKVFTVVEGQLMVAVDIVLRHSKRVA